MVKYRPASIASPTLCPCDLELCSQRDTVPVHAAISCNFARLRMRSLSPHQGRFVAWSLWCLGFSVEPYVCTVCGPVTIFRHTAGAVGALMRWLSSWPSSATVAVIVADCAVQQQKSHRISHRQQPVCLLSSALCPNPHPSGPAVISHNNVVLKSSRITNWSSVEQGCAHHWLLVNSLTIPDDKPFEA
ncbi:uncharacterized protein EI97DRAFT_113775 [Westerdykella ornata]|uniref:Uncharacterized protein n=1 Tax=Westerdykella ornata TaxID=318751 RepID=A0A6A6JVP2_WESOR|nr:uncharacterized protein EI97DRAFT_113775 [Westerdykella ornata]KAF2280173.1 hypothetical protein EI97DRAFT_113775 [Westerdykella ornata]